MNRTLTHAIAITLLVSATAAMAADHREAPLTALDSGADIADVYAFVNPNRANRTVLVMTVNPFSVPSEAGSFAFSDHVVYSFFIDTTGNGRANRAIHTVFDPLGDDGTQGYTQYFPGGRQLRGRATRPGIGVEPEKAIVNKSAPFRSFAGPRDDPFFFDIVGFGRVLGGQGGFTGKDGFAGFNVSAIVVDVPTKVLGQSGRTLGVWASTFRPRFEEHRQPKNLVTDLDFDTLVAFGPDRQIDRMGNPAVATVLIPANSKNLYNTTRPQFDKDNWAAAIVASLDGIADKFGVDPDVATLASVAVTGGDTLKFNPSVSPTAFPFGRNLEDDVIDTLLTLILRLPSGEPLLPDGDGIGRNDVPFLSSFPFLAPPHQP